MEVRKQQAAYRLANPKPVLLKRKEANHLRTFAKHANPYIVTNRRDCLGELGMEQAAYRLANPKPVLLKRKEANHLRTFAKHANPYIVTNRRDCLGELGMEVWAGESQIGSLNVPPHLAKSEI